MKLIIGTVLFGLSYGINKTTKISFKETTKILNTAQKNNIELLDSAPLYGNSEKIIGKQNNSQFKIVTKTPHLNTKEITKKELSILTDTFKNSLKNLNQKNIYGLLIHNTDDLFSKNGYLLLETLQQLKKEKLVEKIGVSVYTPKQIKKY